MCADLLRAKHDLLQQEQHPHPTRVQYVEHGSLEADQNMNAIIQSVIYTISYIIRDHASNPNYY